MEVLPFRVMVGKMGFSEGERIWPEKQALFSVCANHVGVRAPSRKRAQKTAFAVEVWGDGGRREAKKAAIGR